MNDNQKTVMPNDSPRPGKADDLRSESAPAIGKGGIGDAVNQGQRGAGASAMPGDNNRAGGVSGN